MTAACNATDDEHQGYTATNETWNEELVDRTVTWRKHKCQCGARTTDMKDSVQMKGK